MRRIRLLLALGVLVTLAMCVPSAPALAAGGLTIRADTAYDIQTEAGLVKVTSDITVTNVTPNKRSGYSITKYYYYAFSLPIPQEAENVAATSGGRDLTVDVTEDEAGVFKIAEIRLRSRLYYQQSHSIQLTFDFVGAAPRSEVSPVRVNNAFVWFYAWALGDPSKSTVRITAPNGLEVDIQGNYMTETTAEDGRRMWVAEEIPDPDAWSVSVEGWSDGRLASASIDVGSNHVSVRYWPGDTEWRDEVIDTVERALPELREVVGLPFPVEDQLVIRETILPNFYGYGGWYLVADDDIEIGEYVDEGLVIHEISHAWFNRELFDSRWINEGLAEAVSAMVLREEFGEATFPRYTGPDADGFQKLNRWTTSIGSAADADEKERYGYNASWHVLDELITEMGPEGLREVLAAAVNDEIAYVGAGTAESVDERDDWKRFLDLVEERGGATSAPDLFTEYVVIEVQAELMTERSEAREAYAALVARRPEWAPSLFVREPMSDWEFAVALDRIELAGDVLDAVEALEVHAAGVGLSVASTFETRYETIEHTYKGLQEDIAAEEVALDAIDDATVIVDAPRDESTVVGLEGRDPDAELVAARRAFEERDLDGAHHHVEVAVAMLEDAPERGQAILDAAALRRTILIAVGAAVVLGIAAGFGLRHRRNVRRRANEAAGHDAPMFGPPTPATLVSVAGGAAPAPMDHHVLGDVPAPD